MLNFSTETLPARARSAEYSNALARYYTEIEADRSIIYEIRESGLLDARSTGFTLGALNCSLHRCNSLLHRYLIRHFSRQPDYSLQFVKQGSLTLVSDDRELRLQPGEMAFIRPSKTVEYHVDEGGSETYGFHIPWRLAQALSYGQEIALDRVFSRDSGIGACVAALMEAVLKPQGRVGDPEVAMLQALLVNAMIQLGTSPSAASGLDRTRFELMSNVKTITTALLDDPELAPAKVAERAGISVRTLHRSFQASGESFWSWVHDRRLERCHMEIIDPSYARHSITAIAFRWGYNELSTFDRNFRKRYGVSPRMARAQSRGDGQMPFAEPPHAG